MSWPLGIAAGAALIGVVKLIAWGWPKVWAHLRARRRLDAEVPVGFDTAEGRAVLQEWRRELSGEVPVIPGPRRAIGTASVYNPRNTEDYQPRRLRLED